MNNKPLSYESRKAVFLFMDANQRFNFALRSSSIRKTERCTTLRVNSLKFNHMKFKINGTKYQIGIYRKYPEGMEIPKMTREQNEDGGLVRDIDEYGIKTDFNAVLTPGDIRIRDRIRAQPASLERQRAYFETQLQRWERAVHARGFEAVRKHIDYHRRNLAPFLNKDQGRREPYDRYIQLTVTSKSGKRIERYEYTRPIHEAFKYLASSFFGGRASVVQVRRLKLMEDGIVLRLPLGVRFKIRELATKMTIAKVYEVLKPIVAESSYPLNVVENIRDFVNESWDLEHPAIKGAQLIKLWFPHFRYISKPPTNLHQWTVKRAHFIHCSESTPDFNVMPFVMSWVDDGREVGTCYKFGDFPREYLQNLIKKFPRRIVEEGKVVLRMSATSRLQLSCEPSVSNREPENGWTLKMEVVSVDLCSKRDTNIVSRHFMNKLY